MCGDVRVEELSSQDVLIHTDNLRRIHAECFPEEAAALVLDEEEEKEMKKDGKTHHHGAAVDFIERLTAMHETHTCRWFLAFEYAGHKRRGIWPLGWNLASSSSSLSSPVEPVCCASPLKTESCLRERRSNHRERQLIGFTVAAPYDSSVYGMQLAVVRSHRGLGIGTLLMVQVQHLAHTFGHNGKGGRIQATVDVGSNGSRARLLRFYKSHGATVVDTGIGSEGSIRSNLVRIERR